ncbi:MAG: DEAD/DEAH box helicase [Agromyces sp.]
MTVLARDGKTSPFPIQVATLPDSLAGRDVLGRGKTGSGKTLAFALPLVARIAEAGRGRRRGARPLGLVLAPTRELATQITATVTPLADASGLRVLTIFGGVSAKRQIDALRDGIDILVATPGRLEDLMAQGECSLAEVDITVLDEADHMADLGFLPVVTRILNATPRDGQRLLFSATLDNGVDKLVSRFLHNEVLHSVDEANSPVAAMTHHVFEVQDTDAKNALVTELARGRGRRVLFMRTKHQAKKLARKLTDAGIPAVDLHGNLSQGQRDRNLAAFSDGSVSVLVATDVAARGVHVDDVELVVHVDPPAEHKAYLHRSGRTARAGSEGDVVTVALSEQMSDVKSLLSKANIRVTPQRVAADSPAVQSLVGERAAFVKPAPRAAAPAAKAPARPRTERTGSTTSTHGRRRPASSQDRRDAGSGQERRDAGAGHERRGGAQAPRSEGASHSGQRRRRRAASPR